MINNNQGNQPPQKINIQIQPDKINAIYSNAFSITRSAFDITFDFGQQIPQLNNMVNIFSRVTMSPQHAKMFLSSLENCIKDFERQFGPINFTSQMKKELEDKGIGFQPK